MSTASVVTPPRATNVACGLQLASGLGGTKPGILDNRLFVFLVQTSRKVYSTYECDEQFLIVRRNPAACCTCAVGCFSVARGLLLVSRDVESNASLYTKAMLAEIHERENALAEDMSQIKGANMCQKHFLEIK